MTKPLTDYLTALQIQPWQLREVDSSLSSSIVANKSSCASLQSDASQMENQQVVAADTFSSALECLRQTVSVCTACELHRSRTQTVFGVGDTNAKLMIIGEAPGQQEDLKGEPFVGRAGQLLTAMLKSIGFTRDQVYIANILKCRPPENRDPKVSEVNLCTTYLNQQIDLIQPQLLLAVGRIAAHYLLKTKSSLESLRSKIHHFGERQTPLIITYHPAYLLRSPADKKKAYVDLQFTHKTLRT